MTYHVNHANPIAQLRPSWRAGASMSPGPPLSTVRSLVQPLRLDRGHGDQVGATGLQ